MHLPKCFTDLRRDIKRDKYTDWDTLRCEICILAEDDDDDVPTDDDPSGESDEVSLKPEGQVRSYM
jgi:hypothetical protein